MTLLFMFAMYFTHHASVTIHGQQYYPCFTQPAHVPYAGTVKLCTIDSLGGQHGH